MKSKRKNAPASRAPRRGRKAAAVDGAGAAIGSLGLLTFAWLVQRLLPGHSAWQVLLGSTGIWLAVSLLLWQIRKRM